jgi:hypothetical protein
VDFLLSRLHHAPAKIPSAWLLMSLRETHRKKCVQYRFISLPIYDSVGLVRKSVPNFGHEAAPMLCLSGERR